MTRRIRARLAAMLVGLAIAVAAFAPSAEAAVHHPHAGHAAAAMWIVHTKAVHRHTTRPTLDYDQLMLSAAAQYWGHVPACGWPHVYRVPSVGVMWGVQPDSWSYVVNGDCSIYLVDHYWHGLGHHSQWNGACRLMTHEYAHLLGMWDVSGPNTMLSHVVQPWLPDGSCDDIWRFIARVQHG